MASSQGSSSYNQFLSPPPYPIDQSFGHYQLEAESQPNQIMPYYVGDIDFAEQHKTDVIHAFLLEATIDLIGPTEKGRKAVPAWLPLGIISNYEYPLAQTVALLLTGSYTITSFSERGQKFVRVNRNGFGISSHPLQIIRNGNQAFPQAMVIPRNFLNGNFTFQLSNIAVNIQRLPDDAWRPSKDKVVGTSMHPAIVVNPYLPPIVLPPVKKHAQKQAKTPQAGSLLAISNLLHQLIVKKVPEKVGLFKIELPSNIFSQREGMLRRGAAIAPTVYFQAPENMPLGGFNNRQVVMAYANPSLQTTM
ncbi:matrix protein VP40 [Dianlovirus menglaense]|uniref:Matrix protein VP40 n=1 Tax=Dianlovirus menglaense TaxID=3052181 RepID=A0A3Q8U6Q5_9MONO|nr:matrix protein VP40 [Dianlovirus menglaense]AZL87825.1 matrix protein VP40 [Dianlovirus menglaense]